MSTFSFTRNINKIPKRTLIIALGLYITVTASFYTSTVFIGNFMQTLGYTNQQSTIVSSIILIVIMIVFPISAYVSDKVGRRPVLILGIILLILSVYPIFVVLGSMNFTLAIISQVIFAGVISIYMGPIPTVLVEIFPISIRYLPVLHFHTTLQLLYLAVLLQC